ncbi:MULTISPECIES: virulence RhuM family protein [unclassified Lonepinella]|uniref:virulence RhuM family protein n=1 Tax=unclassified Lonepinella TaxID=2642006 RepID=UPI0036DE8761
MNDLIIYNTDDGKSNVALLVRENQVWLTQNQLAELFDTSVQNISKHINNLLQDNELDANSVINYYLITAEDGKQYQTQHYSLDMILAIGFRVRSKRGVQFRRWSNTVLRSYLEKGFLVDSERLKNPQGREDYFDELLEQIREIRASELRFYQKIRELFSLSSDYDKTDKATQMFFAQTQNKLIYAVTHKTAAELICERANAELPNMGLTSWKGKVVRKGDIITAKNYLNQDELDSLNRLVMIFLESAEFRVKNNQDLTLSFWQKNVDQLLEFNGLRVLDHLGHRTHQQMEEFTAEQYAIFHQKRQLLTQQQADDEDLKILSEAENQIKQRN